MGAVIVQAKLPYVTNLPEDCAINTWYFAGTDPAADMITTSVDRVNDFYGALIAYWSGYIAARLDVTVYDVEDAQPRTPIYSGSTALTVGAGASLPLEVALCMSYHRELESGIPAARQRGRLYLGPFDAGALDTSQPSSRPVSALVDAITTAAEVLLSENTANNTWVTFSETLGALSPIVGGWVDDSWDTQRRRGSSPSSRTLWG